MNPDDKSRHTPVAIIGIGAMFPGAPGLKGYWRLLFHGRDAIEDIPESHWSAADYFDADPKSPDRVYCTRGGFLSAVAFDPTEFGLPPAILEATDTSQLLGLVAAKMALDDAGYGDGVAFDRERTSVILGVTGTQELVIPLGARLGHPKWRRALADAGVSAEKTEAVIRRIADSYVSWQENSFPGLLGNVVAGRICNRLDLGGTNCVVDAACASSLSALHLALMELDAGRSDMVLSGGVDTLNDIFMHMCFSRTGVLSRSGDARPFSAGADGTVLGEGVGILALKRLEDARRDGDRVYAVIRSVGSASDGRSQSIYAPRAEGQARALSRAYRAAGIDPRTVELVEAHGTGTRVGDAVEISALKQVLDPESGGAACAVGSVKSMIGHTKAAAGAAGLIKTALALYHKVLPPTLKADPVDPDLKIDRSRFFISDSSRPWLRTGPHPRRAGVSAFGFGGSNYHAVLEEAAAEKPEPAWDGTCEILAFSGDEPASLRRQAAALCDRFKAAPMSEAAFGRAAARTRVRFSASDPWRLLAVVDPEEKDAGWTKKLRTAADALAGENETVPAPSGDIFIGGPEPPGDLAVLFPGQGSQYPDMGRDLVCLFPEAFHSVETFFRSEAADRSDEMEAALYPRIPDRDAEKRLRATGIAQPAIGGVSLAMWRVLQRFGLSADAFAGHSYGELTALCAAGWMDADRFASLSWLRGRLMTEAGRGKDPGAMMAVRAPLAQIEALVGEMPEDLVLANRNAPEQGVVAGSAGAVDAAEEKCRKRGWKTVRLPVAAAFHSPLVAEAAEPFFEAAAGAGLLPAAPVYSNTEAAPYPADTAKASRLLGFQLARPVDFAGEVEALYRAGCRVFLEVGPGRVLTGLAGATLAGKEATFLSMDDPRKKGRGGVAALARTLCRLSALGIPVNLSRWETPQKESRTPKMAVLLSGANLRPAGRPSEKQGPAGQKPAAFAVPARPAPAPQPTTKTAAGQPAPALKTDDPRKAALDSMNASRYSDKKEDRPPADLTDAFRVVEEGIRSMQALQEQTCRAHEKFLDIQAQAAKNLQRLMEGTRSLTGIGQAPAAADRKPHPLPAQPPDAYRQSERVDKPDRNVPAAPPLTAQAPDPEPSAVESNAALEIRETLLSVVSELTGYPPEMIGADMDIEADLGIDSIKRVEILSTVEERTPGLPQVTPDMMGTLRTVDQIAAFLAGQDSHVESKAAGEPQAPAAPTDPEPSAAAPSAALEIRETLLSVVSELTGYPPEMIGADMDIEADLGIDSIKRVEILSTVEERMPGLPQVTPDMMGTLRTVDQIAGFLAGADAAEATDEPEPPRPDAEALAPPAAEQRLVRRAVTLTDRPRRKTASPFLPAGRKIYVSRDQTGLSDAICAALSGVGVSAEAFSLSDALPDFSDAGGLLLLADPCPVNTTDLLKSALLAASKAAGALEASAAAGAGLFCAVTRLDGALGFGGRSESDPVTGGLFGLVKCAAIEWPTVACRALDVDPSWSDPDAVAAEVIEELFCPEENVETGLGKDSRRVPELHPAPPAAGAAVAPDLSPEDVVLITGGARGVTAEAAVALARSAAPILVLLGRSAAPEPEPAWLRDVSTEAGIKKAVLENLFSGGRPSPAQLEEAYRKITAGREILRNLTRMEEAGARVRYFSADIRNETMLDSVLEEVRTFYGPVSAVIHGAGVLDDRLIVDKTGEQFDRVFSTKVDGLLSVLAATAKDPVRSIILFSSVAARFGNRGQADYAMANEVLNKIAAKEARTRTGCRVCAINWGPWDGGMVSAALKREFHRRGIELISPEAGSRIFLAEMAASAEDPAEVVVGAPIAEHQDPAPEAAAEGLCLTLRRELDVDGYPVLSSHVLDGKPVVPFALMADWLGHGALKENPGLILSGLDDIRVLKGIRLDSEKRLVRLMAGKAVREGDLFKADVEIRNGVKGGREVVHYRARAVLSEHPSPAPEVAVPEFDDEAPYHRSVADVYRDILFHGSHLQGIRRILGLSARGMRAELLPAPAPDQWMAEPPFDRWSLDPLVLDSAFQMSIVWSTERFGQPSLPSYAAAYRQYRERFPENGVQAVMAVRETSRSRMKGDFYFMDADGGLIAQLSGYEAVMDPSLVRSLQPDPMEAQNNCSNG